MLCIIGKSFACVKKSFVSVLTVQLKKEHKQRGKHYLCLKIQIKKKLANLVVVVAEVHVS